VRHPVPETAVVHWSVNWMAAGTRCGVHCNPVHVRIVIFLALPPSWV
jgi:hypothetical protein